MHGNYVRHFWGTMPIGQLAARQHLAAPDQSQPCSIPALSSRAPRTYTPTLATASSIEHPGRVTRQSRASIIPTLPSRTPRTSTPTLATASSIAHPGRVTRQSRASIDAIFSTVEPERIVTWR